MSTEWFIIRSSRVVGPFTSGQLKTLAVTGKLGPEDLIRRGDDGKPVHASAIKGLFPAGNQVAVVSSAPKVLTAAPASTPDEWYYGKNGQQFGPVTWNDLKRLAASKQLASSDLVWREGFADWTAAETIAGLFGQPAATAHNIFTARASAATPVAAKAESVGDDAEEKPSPFSVIGQTARRASKVIRSGLTRMTRAALEWNKTRPEAKARTQLEYAELDDEPDAAPEAVSTTNLVPCPDCGTQISRQAKACPKCGRPMVATMRPSAVGTMCFQNQSGYVEKVTFPFLKTLLFGVLYFAVRGIWTHVVVGIILAIFTWGLSWLIYPFFAKSILRRHYLRRGWTEVALGRQGRTLAVAITGDQQFSIARVMAALVLVLVIGLALLVSVSSNNRPERPQGVQPVGLPNVVPQPIAQNAVAPAESGAFDEGYRHGKEYGSEIGQTYFAIGRMLSEEDVKSEVNGYRNAEAQTGVPFRQGAHPSSDSEYWNGFEKGYKEGLGKRVYVRE